MWAVIQKELPGGELSFTPAQGSTPVTVPMGASCCWVARLTVAHLFQVQVEVIQKRQKEKKAMMNAVKKYQKGKQA